MTLIAAGIDSSFDVTLDIAISIMRFLAVAMSHVRIFTAKHPGALREIANGNKYFLSRTSVRKHCTSTADIWRANWRSFFCISTNKYQYRESERAGMTPTAAKVQCYRTLTLYAHKSNSFACLGIELYYRKLLGTTADGQSRQLTLELLRQFESRPVRHTKSFDH